jgi:hypothetical protein
MMSRRSLYTIILGAMLAMAANLMPSSDAQAMNTTCCCSADECRCSGCVQHAADDTVPLLQPLDETPSNTCTCSTGPNPFRTDIVSASPYAEPTKKRLFNCSAFSSVSVSYTLADLPAQEYKPPLIAQQSLYLLNNSLRI